MTVKKVIKPLGGNGGTMLGQVFDDDSDEENSINGSPVPGAGKPGGASRGSGTGQVRRRSSFGGARFKNEEEQTRIVNMYTNIIKMSSENKINEKNSWGLDLIDHMGKLIKADSSKQRGVNFQKASCTLDASVKIYANRVDDTYSHSHRVLESFSRNADSGRLQESDDEDAGAGADPAKSKKAARVGANKASNRLNIGDTIEKNVDNINAKEIEHDVQLDPMFHTISKLFDKGGVEGMLMYNLRVNPFSSTMALNQEGLPDPFVVFLEQPSTATPTATGSAPSSSSSTSGGMLDLTDLIAASQLSMADLAELTICPQLNQYRAQICNKGKEAPGLAIGEASTSGCVSVGSLDPTDFVGSHFFPAEPTEAPLLGPSAHSLTRDLTVIPFADTSAELKEHTFANHKHAYFDGMAAMCAPTVAAPTSTLFNDIDENYADTAGDYNGNNCNDDDGDVNDAGNDADDCDEEGNYVASERRATLAPVASGAESGSTVNVKGNTRMSMLRATDVNGPEDKEMTAATKIHWEAVGGNVEITQNDLLTLPDKAVNSELSEVLTSGMQTSEGSEYAFFDVAALVSQGRSNEWAGAKHWKRGAGRATRASARVTSAEDAAAAGDAAEAAGEHDDADGAVTSTGGKAKKATRPKKAGVEIDFSALSKDSFPAESLFKPAVVRGSASTALLTQAAIKKQDEAAANGEYFLPVDSKLEPKDMCRLFLVPRMIVPPPALTHLLKTAASSSSSSSGDVIWGAKTIEKFSGSLQVDNDNDIAEYGNDDNEDYDDDRFFTQSAVSEACIADDEACGENIPSQETPATEAGDVDEAADATADLPDTAVTEKLSALAIDESKLVHVGRKVGKIDIGYSTVAKRINVKQLKVDIWQEIAQLAGVTREGTSEHDKEDSSENAPPAADFHATQCSGEAQITDKSAYCDGANMSFQGLVNDLAVRQKQKDVSVSFYFICLLHLANEKCLKITDNEDMDDLVVSKDGK